MKKIAVMLAAVLMIFAFAACDDGGDKPRPMTVKLMEEGVEFKGEPVSYFVGPDFELSSSAAKGEVNYVQHVYYEVVNEGYCIPIEIVSPAIADVDSGSFDAMLLFADGSNRALSNDYIEKIDGHTYFLAELDGVNDINTTADIQDKDLVLRYVDENNVIYMATIDLSGVVFASHD